MVAQAWTIQGLLLSGGITRAVLLELLDHAIEIRIAGAKPPSEPVPTTLGDSLAVRDHLELTDLAGRSHRFNIEVFLDEGHETRDLGIVVLSRGAVNDFYLHAVLQSALCSLLTYEPTHRFGTVIRVKR